MLDVQQLSCVLDGRTILDSISFALNAGEVMVLFGPNGAGKSTLLHCLTGYLPIGAGEIRVASESVIGMSVADRASFFSLLSQDRALTFPFQVIDLVLMGRARQLGWCDVPSSNDYVLAERALERVGAGHLRSQNVNTLSSGERQRVLLARTLLQDAAFLLLDEPTSHLDFASQYHFVALIREIAASSGKGVLAVMHDPNLAIRLADRLLLLDRGRCLALGAPAEVLTPERMEAVFQIAVRQVALDDSFVLMPL